MTAKTPTLKLNRLEKLDWYFADKLNLILWMSILSTLLFGFLLFEPKVSIGGDDSMYINRAFNFIKQGTFPAFQGPFYPIVLGLIISVTGVKLLVLKFFSFLCLLAHQWFTFKLFKNYLSPFLLFTFLLLISASAAILYYGSATYNEAFYLLIQSIFLYHFEKSFIRDPNATFDFKKDIGKIAISGLLLFLLTITKNIGLVAIIAALLYFAFVKNWKLALMIIISIAVFMISFKLLKSGIWDVSDTQISSQGSTLLLKNPYNPDLGKEDVKGFLMRFVQNSKAYLGFHFINIFGMSSQKNFRGNTFATLVIYGLFIAGFFIHFRKSKFWLFIGTFIAVSFGASFFALQTYWNQERLIVVFTPLLLVYLLYILNHFFTNGLKKYAHLLIFFLVIMVSANLIRTFTKIPEQTKTISSYLKGDKLYGFPEDWINYLNMAKWANDNLPEEMFVACRKPGMAFIYSGGKNFHGIWKVQSQDPEELYNKLKDAGVTHVIMANLRTNSDDPNSRIINTVRRYLSIVNKAYPGKLKMVHQIGENWPAYLYELQ